MCIEEDAKMPNLFYGQTKYCIFTVKDRKGREKTIPCREYVDVVKRQEREFYTFPLFLMKSSWFFLFLLLLLPSTRILPPSYTHVIETHFSPFFLMLRNIQELKRTKDDKILGALFVWFFFVGSYKNVSHHRSKTVGGSEIKCLNT